MPAKVHRREGVKVVEIEGRLDARRSRGIEEVVLPLVDAGEGGTVVDLSRLEGITAVGLRLLLTLHRHALHANSRLVLVGVSEELREVMDATGFLELYNVSEDWATALRYVRPEED